MGDLDLGARPDEHVDPCELRISQRVARALDLDEARSRRRPWREKQQVGRPVTRAGVIEGEGLADGSDYTPAKRLHRLLRQEGGGQGRAVGWSVKVAGLGPARAHVCARMRASASARMCAYAMRACARMYACASRRTCSNGKSSVSHCTPIACSPRWSAQALASLALASPRPMPMSVSSMEARRRR